MESLPRGGKKNKLKKSSKKPKLKTKSKTKVKSKDDNAITRVINHTNINELFSESLLRKGMLILGRICKESTNNSLTVSLPAGMRGHVQLHDISLPFITLLIKKIELQISSLEFKGLQSLYKCGDYVVCYIKHVEEPLYSLAMLPQIINENIHNSQLVKNATIVCTIQSIEKHGYTIDTGILNVRAFLATEDVDRGIKYYVGHQLVCIIKEVETRNDMSIVKLSARKKKINNIKVHDTAPLNTLIPGTKFLLRVTKVFPEGLQVTFGKNNIGYIIQFLLKDPLSMYTENMILTGTLLYIAEKEGKFACFSQMINEHEIVKLYTGDVIENAKILYKLQKGIILHMPGTEVRGMVCAREYKFIHSIELKPGNTIPKCRIMDYNRLDRIYNCTVSPRNLHMQYISTYDIKCGDIVNVNIMNIQFNNIIVKIDNIVGFVPMMYQVDNLKSIPTIYQVLEGMRKTKRKVEARVMDVKIDCYFNAIFSLKKSIIRSNLPVLSNFNDAICGEKYHATISKIDEGGLDMKFYGSLVGSVPSTALDNYKRNNRNFFVGQTITVLVMAKDEETQKMELKILPEDHNLTNNTNFIIGERVTGIVIDAARYGIHLKILHEGKDEQIGFLPALHMSPCVFMSSDLAFHCEPGTVMSAFVFHIKPHLILSQTFTMEKQSRWFDSLNVDDCIPCTIREVRKDGVRVRLPIEDYSKEIFIPSKEVFSNTIEDQIIFVKIMAIDKLKKRLTLSISLKDLYDNLEEEFKMMSMVNLLNLHFDKTLLMAKCNFFEDEDDFRLFPSVALGEKVTGAIVNINKDYLSVRLLNNRMWCEVPNGHYFGQYEVGQWVVGTVLWKDFSWRRTYISLLPELINSLSPENDANVLPTDVALEAEILMTVKYWFALILIRHFGKCYFGALPIRRHVNDFNPNVTLYKVRAKILVHIIISQKETKVLPICVEKTMFETKTIKNATIIRNEVIRRRNTPKYTVWFDEIETADEIEFRKEQPKGDTRIRDVIEWSTDSSDKSKNEKDETESEFEEKSEKMSVSQSSNCSANSSDESENENDESIENKSNISECEFSWGGKTKHLAISPEISSDEGEESEKESNRKRKLSTSNEEYSDEKQKPKKKLLREKKESRPISVKTSSDKEEEHEEKFNGKKKKLSPTERRNQIREEERKIRQREEVLASDESPNSTDQFDKLVLSNPDSSSMWLKYIIYHLQDAEIDKARAVVKRAIKTINLREENERLNVWKMWLNLESKYGTLESLNNVFQDAARTNDAFEIYNHMLDIHVDAGRKAKLVKLIDTMIGKFKQDFQTWINCGAALLKVGLKKKSRHIMQRAILSLPDSQYPNLLVRFANMENKLGDEERAQILFENVLTAYPKRVDVWSSYVDSLIKSDNIDKARKVLERACDQKLPPKKMKTLFRKFQKFEKIYGTPETEAHIIQMATDYVENM